MKPRALKKHFLQTVKAAGLELVSLTPMIGSDLMIDSYRDERVDGCELEKDGDMLLFQWGCEDWGDGESFELDITRQMIDGAHEDENIYQLSLTFIFKPNATLKKIANGNRWCASPNELDEFRAFISESAAVTAVKDLAPLEITLELEVAG